MSKKTVSWEQIADILIEDFTKKDYKKDEKMMSENEMAIRFGVPRAEIRRAYERLKELGYIYSIQGCGSFFSGKKEKIRLVLTDSSSFSEKMKKLNVNYRSVNLGAERLKETSPVFGLLNAKPDEPVYKITRLRLVDQNPVAIHTSYVSQENFPQIAKDASSITSLFEYIKNCGYTDFSNENSDITVSSLTAKERKLLNVQGFAPCLILTTKCISQNDHKILEVARTVYRSDKFVFVLR